MEFFLKDASRPSIQGNSEPGFIGDKLTDFRIISELGRGSYGVIKKVVSLVDNKEYVMKKIDMQLSKIKSHKSAMKEVEILKKVNHPHIIKYYTSFVENSFLYIIMEYAEGGDMSKLVRLYKTRGKQFSEKQIWRFAWELCQAIDYLHQHYILHRDIKASNVFLTKDLRIKVGDLGISKIVSKAAPLQGTKIGTPFYLAPEMIKELPYDFKVDIWALGCLLYDLANLHHPFQGENIISLGYNIVHSIPRPLSAAYSTELGRFVMSLLTKDPLLRPSISELKRSLQNKREFIGQMETEKLESQIDEVRDAPVYVDSILKAGNISSIMNRGSYQYRRESLFNMKEIEIFDEKSIRIKIDRERAISNPLEKPNRSFAEKRVGCIINKVRSEGNSVPQDNSVGPEQKNQKVESENIEKYENQGLVKQPTLVSTLKNSENTIILKQKNSIKLQDSTHEEKSEKSKYDKIEIVNISREIENLSKRTETDTPKEIECIIKELKPTTFALKAKERQEDKPMIKTNVLIVEKNAKPSPKGPVKIVIASPFQKPSIMARSFYSNKNLSEEEAPFARRWKTPIDTPNTKERSKGQSQIYRYHHSSKNIQDDKDASVSNIVDPKETRMNSSYETAIRPVSAYLLANRYSTPNPQRQYASVERKSIERERVSVKVLGINSQADISTDQVTPSNVSQDAFKVEKSIKFGSMNDMLKSKQSPVKGYFEPTRMEKSGKDIRSLKAFGAQKQSVSGNFSEVILRDEKSEVKSTEESFNIFRPERLVTKAYKQEKPKQTSIEVNRRPQTCVRKVRTGSNSHETSAIDISIDERRPVVLHFERKRLTIHDLMKEK